MHTVRAFFAIVPPKEIQIHLLRVLNALKKIVPSDDIRWVPVENLHVTLQFLGQFHLDDVKPFIEKVREELKYFSPFQLELGSLTWFPDEKRAKIMSLTMKPQLILTTLAHMIADVISTFHYPVESRPFRAHMTLGRLLTVNTTKVSLPQIKLPLIPHFIVDTIDFLESKAYTGKTSYISFAKIKIGN